MNSKIVGIDLGTTNSLIGVMDSGFPILVPDEKGNRLLSSVVHFSQKKEIIIGESAKRAGSVLPQRTIRSVKRIIGKRFQEWKTEGKKEMGYSIFESSEESQNIEVKIENDRYSPEKISSHILLELKKRVENYLGEKVDRAVITVPAYFNDRQRSATKKAGELAGFQVERIINEPTAAALAYGIDRSHQKAKIAVYDFGGGTFDISILEMNKGVFQVLSTCGHTQLGGDDIDEVITEYLISLIQKEGEISVTEEIKNRVREEAENLKQRLSSEEETKVELPFLTEEVHFSTVVERGEIEKLSRPVIDKTRSFCQRALQDAGIKTEELDCVLLVGGQTRMPLIRETVQEIFQKEASTSVHPDEAVALGATIQAGILSGELQNMVLLDVTPLSLGIETFGGLMNVIIPRNTTIPVKQGEAFTTAVDNQPAIRIKVLQGERELARDNWELGNFELEFEKAPRGVPRIGVQFEIDHNGILHVLARDIATGKEQVIQVNSAVDVADEKVEQMVAESVEHAFEDMNERQWIETKMKAEKILQATEKAIKGVGDDLSEEEKEKINHQVKNVETQLEKKDLKQLKIEVQLLDKITENLAQLLIDKTMEAALRKQGVL